MQETVKKVLNGDFNRKKALLFLITALLTVIVWNLPIDSFGIEGLTIVQQRVIAIFVMAVMLWLTEAIPAWATSVVIIFVLLFFVSDSAFKIMQGSEAEMGKLLDYQGVMACFADPTIILFLGGFVLAIAATKSGLDVMMAKALIAPFGKRSENVLLGFMLITGIFSMFISNTATAAMMLTFLTPVFKSLPPSGKGRVALTMAIPIGANLGGMGTPIGTPPNAFAFKVLNDPAGLNLGHQLRRLDADHGPYGAHHAPHGMGHHPQDVPVLCHDHRAQHRGQHAAQLAHHGSGRHLPCNHRALGIRQAAGHQRQHRGHAPYRHIRPYGSGYSQGPEGD